MQNKAPFPFAADTGRRTRRNRGMWLRTSTILIAVFIGLTIGIGAIRGASSISLDRMAREDNTPFSALDRPGNSFTGSAFFFAEGAFDPAPDAPASGGGNQHILSLRRVNAALAVPFSGMTPLDRYRALNCLTSAIYYEAANEPEEGQRAVAQVVLNRVRHPAWPKSVCGVVYQGAERTDLLCQFTFSCDGAMARRPVATIWARAQRVAESALAGRGFAPVGYATFYHTLAVRPEWSGKLDAVAVVGAHIFYQMRGANGQALAFRIPYPGHEPVSGPPPRVWKPIPAGAIPVAMPYLPEMLNIGSTPPAAASNNLPLATPGIQAPSFHQIPSSPSGPSVSGSKGLPESQIRPEYQNSGRPIT